MLICEEGDLETQRLNPENCLTIPHTVDCLQVGRVDMMQLWTMRMNMDNCLSENPMTTLPPPYSKFVNTEAAMFSSTPPPIRTFAPQGILSVIPLQLLSYHMAVLK